MIKRLFKCVILLNVLDMCVKALIIGQTNKKVIVDEINNLEPQLYYVKEDLGLVQVASFEPPVAIQLQHGECATAVDYHYPKKLLFWTTMNGRIYSCHLKQSSKIKLVHEEGKWLPIALAVDYLNDRLYIIDGRTNTLRLLDVDAKYSVVLSVGLRNYRPTHVEVDPCEGYVFLLDEQSRNGHILRMSMDGSNSKIIDPPSFRVENQTGKITLDRIHKRILVSSRILKNIFSMDYDGNILNTVLEPQTGALSMSVTKEELFWVNANFYSSGTTFVDGSVYKCKYEKIKGCHNNSLSLLYDSFPGNRVLAVKVIDPESQNRESVNNLNSDTSGCEQLRVGSHCACETGWRLENDLKSCVRIDEFIIYENNGIIRSACLEEDKIGNCQAIEPFQVKLQLSNRERTGFVYDSTTRKLYYGGFESIHRVDIDTGIRTQLLYQRRVFFGPMALDWIAKNLYYTEIEWRGNVTFYILKAMSIRTDDPNCVQQSTTLLWEFSKIHSMAVHPEQGYLFISAIDNKIKKYCLVRLNADTRNFTVLRASGEAKFLSIDYLEDRLYILTANDSSISSCNFYGNEIIKINNGSSIQNITGFLVKDKFIYIKNNTSVHRFNKSSGEYLGKFDISPYDLNMSTNIRLHSSKIFKTASNRNPCSKNNGGCENFCFGVPQVKENITALEKSCKCYDGVKCKLNP